MKFELKAPWQRFSDDELLNDLRRVAAELQAQTITKGDYTRLGRHDRGTFTKRFGSWEAALEKAGLTPKRPLTEEDLVNDLKRVANQLGRNFVSFVEYRKLGRWSERPFVRVFGNWRKAVEAAGLDRHPNLHERIPDELLFENLERVWVTLGRQPSYRDIEKPLSSFSSTTYLNRFGTWRAALEAFVSWVNAADAGIQESQPPATIETLPPPSDQTPRSEPQLVRQRATRRAVNLRLRFRVMQRDNFTCRFCGRSPALHAGLVLHVDHVVPWDKGGETNYENLQTLCEPCNLGKGNLLER